MQTATIKGPYCSASIGTGLTSIGGYTPASSAIYAIVNGIYITNKTGGLIYGAVTVYNGSTDYYIAYNTPINNGDSFYVPGKVELVSGWSVRANCNLANGIDAVMFVTEFT